MFRRWQGRLLLGFLAAATPSWLLPAYAQSVLHTDLALHFKCDQLQKTDVSTKFSGWLIRHGFRVLDRAKVQNEHGVFLLEVDLVAIHSNGNLFDLKLFPRSAVYFSTLITPPPTKRNAELELSIVKFITEDLPCAITQTTKGTNDVGSEVLYENVKGRILNQFLELEGLQGKAKRKQFMRRAFRTSPPDAISYSIHVDHKRSIQPNFFDEAAGRKC